MGHLEGVRLMRSYLVLASVLAALAATSASAAFKCVGPDGKVTFSDQRCENEAAKPAAAADKAEAAPTPGQERLKALDVILRDKAANDEKKTAAMLEAGNIRRGLEAQMKPADRERRMTLSKDLDSPDAAKRAAALREIRSLYRE
jgi:hypothetical protein